MHRYLIYSINPTLKHYISQGWRKRSGLYIRYSCCVVNQTGSSPVRVLGIVGDDTYVKLVSNLCHASSHVQSEIFPRYCTYVCTCIIMHI